MLWSVLQTVLRTELAKNLETTINKALKKSPGTLPNKLCQTTVVYLLYKLWDSTSKITDISHLWFRATITNIVLCESQPWHVSDQLTVTSCFYLLHNCSFCLSTGLAEELSLSFLIVLKVCKKKEKTQQFVCDVNITVYTIMLARQLIVLDSRRRKT